MATRIDDARRSLAIAHEPARAFLVAICVAQNVLPRRVILESSAATRAYDDLVLSMSVDQDNDVLVTSDGLRARGRLFAFMDGNDLVVALPEARARDLIQRAVGYEFEATGHPGRAWVRIRDRQLWSELAREAHEYVGEPPVGGDS